MWPQLIEACILRLILSACIDMSMQTGNEPSIPELYILHNFVYHCGLILKTVFDLVSEQDVKALCAQRKVDRIGTDYWTLTGTEGNQSFSPGHLHSEVLLDVGHPFLRSGWGCSPNDPYGMFKWCF